MDPWRIRGELTLNCNCAVFCPCVASLGEHPPTHGYCQTWGGIRIDEGHVGGADLSGLNAALLIDIPGRMSEGGWSLAAWIDERADDDAFAGLSEILSGRARGTTGLFSVLVGNFLGVERAPVRYETEGDVRIVEVGRTIRGRVSPIAGARDGQPVRITNSRYWISPEITMASAEQGRVRAFGRVWNLEGRSAEICQFDWKGP